MSEENENIKQIGSSISEHATEENNKNIENRAFARARCILSSAKIPGKVWTFWLTNKEDYQGMRMQRDFTGTGTVYSLGRKTALQTSDGQNVYKNTRLGEVLTKYVSGSHSYTAPGGVHTLDILNRASYMPNGSDPAEVEIRIANDPGVYRYQRLSHLLNAAKAEEAKLKKQIEELKRIEEEKAKLARELEEKKEREEQQRIEALRIQKEEEERKMREDIARIEQAQADLIEREKSVRSFMRKNVMLRSQHLLDQYQEDAKRSHIYDGVPIVIDGGPGTGKTTTMIQRLMFLLSYQALEEYGAPISLDQLEELTDASTRDEHWLFFSPTEMLLQYLRDNMREEGLRANDRNTRTVPRFRNKIMKDYQLFNPSKDGPFKDYKPSEGENKLINDAQKAIRDFEKFIIDYCNKTFIQRIDFKTDEHIWHDDAQRIKTQCARGGRIKDVDALMRLFNSLQDNEKANIKEWSDSLREELKESAMILQRKIVKDETASENLKTLFERWRRERINVEDVDDDEAIIDDEEDENEQISFSRQEFETQLYSELRKLIKQIGLKKFDSKIKLSKHNQEIHEIVKDFIDEEELSLEYIGSVATFVRNYASLCRGIESNIIGIIPKLYKAFRKSQLEGKLYNVELLKKIIAKDSNKHLHPDEQSLIVGFINEMLHGIYRKSHVRFDNLKHKYAKAFKESVRNVIGVDEATDYSLIDYYFMLSFRHYTFCSITLCGDIMQGLNDNGIKDWDELKKFLLPNLEVKSLNISYRQLPTLLNMARELYHDDQGFYPAYQSEIEQSDQEPKPVMCISDDEDYKAKWIAWHIRDILNNYDGELPSIAIFVGDNVEIAKLIERIEDTDLINGIDVVDCSGDKQLQNKEMVRIFRLSEVKGMEFEAAFFYDIDDAISSHNLMRRYLYVGISRATSHLAATMRSDENKSIIKYFETENTDW